MTHSIEITSIDNQIPLVLQTEKDEKEEGRKVDHLIEMIFDEMFEVSDNSSITMFKVNVGLRESNPDAYTPKMISIGPYHKENPQLHPMKKYKLLYLLRFLQRKMELDVKCCISELEKLKEEAIKCYDDIEDLGNDSRTGEFLQMLLLDGCFVVEFIRESFGIFPEAEDKIIKGDSIYSLIVRDLLLVENQLPFFVLTKLHDMTKDVYESPLAVLANLLTFFSDLPMITLASFTEEDYKAGNINHLLHLVHMSCCNSLQTNSSKRHRRDKDHRAWQSVMPNAGELSKAGVSFVNIGNIHTSLDKHNIGDKTNFFDINFENGQMKIPCFRVFDNTESIMRNLIAYEQQLLDVSLRYFSDFSSFMNYLIESNRDVNLLRQKGIIENNIGEDKEVASLFNKIGKGVTIYSDFYYKEECRKAVQHCQKPWNLLKANLKSNYFSSPWAGASTVAAVILLLLTTIQTILSFIGGVK